METRGSTSCVVDGNEDKTHFRSVRKICVVLRSSALTIACLMFSCTYDSFVAMKTVPQLTPCAPRARAAARPRPSPIPPEAMYGVLSLRAARAS